jgi:Fe2+ or Zn2+ uptake regulation protein
MTSQRLAILHVLHHEGTHLSPTAIYQQARTQLAGLTEPRYIDRNSGTERLVRRSHASNGHLIYRLWVIITI